MVSLEKFNQKLKTLNKDNKNLLDEVIYSLTSKNDENKNLNDDNNFSINKTDEFNKKLKANTSFFKTHAETKIDNKIYTHIHVDPVEFLNKHLKERIKTTKDEEKELFNFTKNSASILNRSKKFSTENNSKRIDFMKKNLNLNLNTRLGTFSEEMYNYL